VWLLALELRDRNYFDIAAVNRAAVLGEDSYSQSCDNPLLFGFGVRIIDLHESCGTSNLSFLINTVAYNLFTATLVQLQKELFVGVSLFGLLILRTL